MSSSDLYVDGFPHGTPQGYDDGCRGGACPAGVAYGLSCKTAKAKSRGDFQYRKLVKAGAGLAEIAEALGLIGTESLPTPTKKSTAKASPAPSPTPATAKGGRSIAETFTATAHAFDQMRDDALSRAADLDEPTATAQADQDPPAAASEEAEPAAEEAPAATADADRVPAAPAPKTGEIRAWAIAKGYKVGAKGKLPQHVVDHYWEATGRLNSTPAAEVDTAEDTPAPEVVTADAQVDTETDPEISDTFVDISIDVPEELLPPARPEWGDVAESVDVEAARAIAVRLEQELAHTTQLLEQERESGTDLAREYLNEIGKTIAQEERITDLRNRLERETNLRKIAERAASFALIKWGEERADNEAAHSLIIGQAHTINQLTAALAPARWIMPDDVKLEDLPADPRPRIMGVDEARELAVWPRT